MPSKSKTSSRTLATQSEGLHSRIPRTMPVTLADSLDFSASMADVPNSNFSLTSSCAGSRRSHGVNTDLVSCTSHPDSGSESYYISTPSTMSYGPMTSGTSYTAPVMPTMASFEYDSTYEFLVDDVVSNNTSADISFASYPGQGPSQEVLASYMDLSMYNPNMMNYFGQDGLNWSNPIARPDTPPPEDYIRELLPQQFSSVQDFPEDTCSNDQDITVYEVHDISRSSSYSSANRRDLPQPRPIRPASERGDSSGDHVVSLETRTIKDDQVDKVKARSHPYYEAKAKEDGKYYCPLKDSTGCNHEPTGQRCIYNKYLDSHLRPYRCKYADRGDCEEARFSSNACLFRHEREAHGLHNHGVNPFLCKFPDCDRSREGNGFPRRWNQRDHMKRVHDYAEAEDPKERSAAPESSRRRKGSGAPTSAAMRRSTSSAHAKAQAMAGAAIPKYYGRVSQARYAPPRHVYWPDASQCRYTPSLPA